MSDLYIDGDMLDRVRRSLRSVEDLLGKPIRAMADIDAKSMGAAELERRMEEFGGEWAYGISQMKKFAKGAAKTLDRIEKTFDKLDVDLAAELSKAAKPK
ncbi:hypothetical protein [Streptomyces kanamyceticus]|uniref:WXG100 family type VII secretion target n=1 Tax=Streptomyces kanamyceticus TaxID=1967 RepID=A0A5J6GDJ3_STRKN|nr:hypothetical protein [Streptomyces kanamyceticus]QEU92542.1 hypothetical protein CP970_17970 [Streptomyces kanamyceticus]